MKGSWGCLSPCSLLVTVLGCFSSDLREQGKGGIGSGHWSGEGTVS